MCIYFIYRSHNIRVMRLISHLKNVSAIDDIHHRSFNNISITKHLESYTSIIKKMVLGSNFIELYSHYYLDKIITRDRISKMLGLHIFGIINIELVDIQVTYFHRTINVLTNKICKTYIETNNSNSINTVDIIDISDTTKLIKKLKDRSITQSAKYFIKNCLLYKSIWFRLLYNQYKSYDINNCVRIWISNNIKPICKTTYIVLIDSMNDLINLNCYPASTVFVEIRGFSAYSDFLDCLRFGITDHYDTMFEDVIFGIGKTIDIIKNKYSNTSVCLVSQQLVSIFVPEILDRFGERIDNILSIDPVFFPWTYHRAFDLLRSNELYHNVHILNLMHRRTMFKTFHQIMNQSKINGILSNKVIVVFRSDRQFDQIIYDLQIMLSMYSNVRLNHTNKTTVADIINAICL